MQTIVMEARGLPRGSSGPALETYLRRQQGICAAEASYVGETVTISFDEAIISVSELRRLIEAFGCVCHGESLPEHLSRTDEVHSITEAQPSAPLGHAATAHAMAADDPAPMTHEVDHGGGRGMDQM
ncbi:MAG: hypothetical protein IVW57_13655, partial [Ktedonobacterales bacterium]|nr:hypothetical protein [Ktedonobacterales bacterium]